MKAIQRLFLAAGVSLAFLAGCDEPTGPEQPAPTKQPDAPAQTAPLAGLSVPPGGTAQVKRTTTTTSEGGTSKTNEHEVGAAGSAKTTGDGKLSQEIQTTAPGVSTSRGASATGGGTTGKSSVISAPNLWKNPFFWAGVFCLLLAGACVVVPKFFPAFPLKVPARVPMVLCIAAGVLFAIAVFPYLLLIGIGVVFVIVVGPWILAEINKLHQTNRADVATESTRALVGAIGTAPPEAAQAVLNAAVGQADPQDRAFIHSVAAADDLNHVYIPERLPAGLPITTAAPALAT